RTLARQMSGPVPSPSIKGIMGLSGTTSRPFCREMAVPVAGGFTVVKVVIALGHITRHVLPDLHRNCGKVCGNRIALGASPRANPPFQAVCTTIVRAPARRSALSNQRNTTLY